MMPTFSRYLMMTFAVPLFGCGVPPSNPSTQIALDDLVLTATVYAPESDDTMAIDLFLQNSQGFDVNLSGSDQLQATYETSTGERFTDLYGLSSYELRRDVTTPCGAPETYVGSFQTCDYPQFQLTGRYWFNFQRNGDSYPSSVDLFVDPGLVLETNQISDVQVTDVYLPLLWSEANVGDVMDFSTILRCGAEESAPTFEYSAEFGYHVVADHGTTNLPLRPILQHLPASIAGCQLIVRGQRVTQGANPPDMPRNRIAYVSANASLTLPITNP